MLNLLENKEEIVSKVKNELLRREFGTFKELIRLLPLSRDIVIEVIDELEYKEIDKLLEVTFFGALEFAEWVEENKRILRKNENLLENLSFKSSNVKKEIEKRENLLKNLNTLKSLKEKKEQLDYSIASKINNLLKKENDELKVVNQKLQEELEKLRPLLKTYEDKIAYLEKELKSGSKVSKNVLVELKENLNKKEKIIEKLQQENKNLEKNRISLRDSEIKVCEELKKSLEGFEVVVEIITSKLLQDILFYIIKIPEFRKFRLKSALNEINAENLFNLSRLMVNADVFVNFYYPFLLEAKRKSKKIMS